MSHRTDTKNKINSTIDDFSITPVDGDPDKPVQSLYPASQLRNYSLILPRISSYSANANCMSYMTCALWWGPSGAGLSLGAAENRVTETRGRADDLWPFGAKSRPKQVIRIHDSNKKLGSGLIAIKDPYSDGARAIVKENPTAFLKAPEKVTKEAKKAPGL